MIRQVAYTNSKCSDVWDMFIGENALNTWMRLYMITDKDPDNFGCSGLYLYSNGEPYYQVWTNALEYFNEDYFLYLQEDFVLYNIVNDKRISEYTDFLKANKEYSFIRLFKCTTFKDKPLTETLYEIESNNKNVFAMQATIWRTEDYLKLMDAVKSQGWLETDADYRKAIKRIGMKGAYHYESEPLRGKYHYDSFVYPHIATALVKGKWNLKDYQEELSPLITKYNIDISKRGVK